MQVFKLCRITYGKESILTEEVETFSSFVLARNAEDKAIKFAFNFVDYFIRTEVAQHARGNS